MDTVSTLTTAQQAAISHTSGPLLIIAGPGAGKTREFRDVEFRDGLSFSLLASMLRALQTNLPAGNRPEGAMVFGVIGINWFSGIVADHFVDITKMVDHRTRVRQRWQVISACTVHA